LAISGGLGYLLFKMQTGSSEMIERTLGSTVAGFLGNEALREGVLGLIAIAMVLSLVIYMWRTGPKLKKTHGRPSHSVSDESRLARFPRSVSPSLP
jgi:hypothetical protein